LKEIQIRELEVTNNKWEGMVMLNLHIQLASVHKAYEQHENCAKEYTTRFDSNHYLWKQVLEVDKVIDEINE
jgi:hypothetical protein